MKFWGTEVKPGQTVSCIVDNEHFIHVSQAALGKTKKGNEKVILSVKVDDTKVVIGTLSAENHPHFLCDLVFEKEFELSHSSKTASVFLSGYKADMHYPFESSFDEEEDEEEPKKLPVVNQVIDEEEPKKLPAVNLVSDKSKGKSTGNDEKKDKDEDDSDESDDDLQFSSDDDDMTEDESSSEEDESSSEEVDTSSEEDESSNEEVDTSSEEDESSSEEDVPSSEEDEVIPQPKNGKKRVTETALTTPASNKKAKIATPSDEKTGDKKGIHVATPHPAKQASKTANGKSKEKSPKSTGGSHVCKSCSRTFGSDSALQSHEKAKHKGAASGDM